jgi:Spy/CpxP family protein refolding chaperone
MNHLLMTIKSISICAVLIMAAPVHAQHSGHDRHHHQSTTPVAQTATPYAGQHTRSIKALSGQETQDWLEGKGMGLAKAAELNGYPGPMHVLELQNQLKLTPTQRQATEALMAEHKSDVRKLGTELVAAEQALDQAFASHQIDAAAVERHTARIGTLQAQIRASHLNTHLQQTRLLEVEQVTTYNALRGYIK